MRNGNKAWQIKETIPDIRSEPILRQLSITN